MAVEAAGAEGGVVDTGLTGRVTGSTDPVSSGLVSDGSGGADGIAVALVAVESVSTVVADTVLGALLASGGAALAD